MSGKMKHRIGAGMMICALVLFISGALYTSDTWDERGVMMIVRAFPA